MTEKYWKTVLTIFTYLYLFKIKGIHAAAQFQQVPWNKIPKHYKCLACYSILISTTLEKKKIQAANNQGLFKSLIWY